MTGRRHSTRVEASGKRARGDVAGGVTVPTRAALELSLRDVARPERAKKEQAYLKSKRRHIGVSVPEIRRVARQAHGVLRRVSKSELFRLVRELSDSGTHELFALAVELLVADAGRLSSADLRQLETLIRQAKTWALVDPLAVHVVGEIARREPGAFAKIDGWAEDDDFWIRRAALLALLKPLREGAGDLSRFARYADANLDDPEFFVQKAIGWVLREASRKRPLLVAEFVEPRAARMRPVAFRESTRRLPDKMQKALGRRRQSNDPSGSPPRPRRARGSRS